MDSSTRTARILLQLGLSFVFAYASLEVFLNPEGFLKYVPNMVRSSPYLDKFMLLFSLGEAVLVVWLLSGKALRLVAALSFILLVSITLLNLEYFSVLFRNVAIALAALALVVLS